MKPKINEYYWIKHEIHNYEGVAKCRCDQDQNFEYIELPYDNLAVLFCTECGGWFSV